MKELISLHRYWIASSRMRDFFNAEIKDKRKEYQSLINLSEDEKTLASYLLFLDDFFILKSYWYASLYVVIEGYKELQIKNDNVQKLWNEDFINKLRLFRNGTFHYQKDIFSEIISNTDDTDEFVKWIHAINHELGRALVQEMTKYIPPSEVEKMFQQKKK